MAKPKPVGNVRCLLGQARQQKGLSQYALAKLAVVTRKTINTIESGLSIPNYLLAVKLCELVDLPLDQLYVPIKKGGESNAS